VTDDDDDDNNDDDIHIEKETGWGPTEFLTL